MSSQPSSTRVVTLASRPVGEPVPENFAIVDAPLPEPGPGQVVVRNVYMSVDPAMRGRMEPTEKHYTTNFEVGGPLDGSAIGEVVVGAPGLRRGHLRAASARLARLRRGRHGGRHDRRRGARSPAGLAGHPRSDRVHGVRRAGARRRAGEGRHRVRVGGRGCRGQRGRPVRQAARRGPRHRQRGRGDEGAAARRRARVRRRHRLSRRPPRRPGRGRTGRHRPLLRQRRRRPPGRGSLRAARARPRGAVRDDLGPPQQREVARDLAPHPGDPQAADDPGFHRPRPRGPAARVRAARVRVAAQRRGHLARDGRQRTRERRRRVRRNALRRQRRQGAGPDRRGLRHDHAGRRSAVQLGRAAPAGRQPLHDMRHHDLSRAGGLPTLRTPHDGRRRAADRRCSVDLDGAGLRAQGAVRRTRRRIPALPGRVRRPRRRHGRSATGRGPGGPERRPADATRALRRTHAVARHSPRLRVRSPDGGHRHEAGRDRRHRHGPVRTSRPGVLRPRHGRRRGPQGPGATPISPGRTSTTPWAAATSPASPTPPCPRSA